MKKYIASALLSVCMLAGCTNWERATFQTLSASKATIDGAQASYEARTLPHTQCVNDIITKAKAAQTLTVDAMMTYETAKGSSTSTAAQNVVTADLAQLVPILASIQTLGTGTCAASAAVNATNWPVIVGTSIHKESN